MKFKKILLFYKESVFEKRSRIGKQISKLTKSIVEKQLDISYQVHLEHYQSIKKVEKILKDQAIPFDKLLRSTRKSLDQYDLIITLGGDGTFLEASHRTDHQAVFGVNSAPSRSVGNYCQATAKTFDKFLKKIIAGKCAIKKLSRLELKLNGVSVSRRILNDILLSHENPASMSRYLIKVGRQWEEQRSSGIWISTPTGSTGALRSAGGKAIPRSINKFIYHPRELFRAWSKDFKYTGGILSSRQTVDMVSLMDEGQIFLDGSHRFVSFPYSTKAEISLSKRPLKVLKFS